MGADFGVDLAWLRGMVAVFNGCAESAERALHALEETGPIRMGHKDLDTACDGFQDHWKKKAGDFRRHVQELGKGVDAAQANYGSTEQAIVANMTALSAPSASGPASGAPPATSNGTTPGQTRIAEGMGW